MNGGYNVTKIIYIITEAPLITAVTIAHYVEGGQLGGQEYYNGKNKIYKNITGIL